MWDLVLHVMLGLAQHVDVEGARLGDLVNFGCRCDRGSGRICRKCCAGIRVDSSWEASDVAICTAVEDCSCIAVGSIGAALGECAAESRWERGGEGQEAGEREECGRHAENKINEKTMGICTLLVLMRDRNEVSKSQDARYAML